MKSEMTAPGRVQAVGGPPFWSRTAAEVLAELEAAPGGLSEDEARARLERFGPNALAPPRRATALTAFLNQFRSPLVLILVFAAGVAALAGDWTDAVIVTLVANTRGKPLFSICGIMTEPIAEVSATAEPEMPLRNVVASTSTSDSPPRTRVKPTSTSAKATMRRAMPPSAMIAPARTKNGIVSIATLLTPSEIFSITASSGMPIHRQPAIAASASE